MKTSEKTTQNKLSTYVVWYVNKDDAEIDDVNFIARKLRTDPEVVAGWLHVGPISINLFDVKGWGFVNITKEVELDAE